MLQDKTNRTGKGKTKGWAIRSTTIVGIVSYFLIILPLYTCIDDHMINDFQMLVNRLDTGIRVCHHESITPYIECYVAKHRYYLHMYIEPGGTSDRYARTVVRI